MKKIARKSLSLGAERLRPLSLETGRVGGGKPAGEGLVHVDPPSSALVLSDRCLSFIWTCN
jgi:hypothetical protein